MNRYFDKAKQLWNRAALNPVGRTINDFKHIARESTGPLNFMNNAMTTSTGGKARDLVHRYVSGGVDKPLGHPLGFDSMRRQSLADRVFKAGNHENQINAMKKNFGTKAGVQYSKALDRQGRVGTVMGGLGITSAGLGVYKYNQYKNKQLESQLQSRYPYYYQ